LVRVRNSSITHSRTPPGRFFIISERCRLWGPPRCQYIHRLDLAVSPASTILAQVSIALD